MKILSITAQKPHSTGSGTYLTELVNAFHLLGHDQAVVAGIYPEDTVSFPEEVLFYPVVFGKGEDVQFPIAGMSDIMPYVSTKYPEMTEEQIQEWSQAFRRVIGRAVDEFNPDIILSHHLFMLTAMIREWYPDRIVMGVSHGSDLRQTISCTHLQDRIKPGIASLNAIFALHDVQKNQIIDIYGAEPEKVHVIGSGYNSQLFNSEGRLPRTPGDPVRICFAGKMSNAKGVNELLASLDDLIAGGANIAVTLAGGCQEPEILKKLEYMPEEISYIGMIPQAKLAQVFRENDIFVLPSYYEGLSLVVMEAMACGMLPVSTDLPGFQKWISANVPDPNVRYIPMPEMATVDQPTESGRIEFQKNLTEILTSAIETITACDEGLVDLNQPDTSRITWRAVAEKIINFI